MNDMPPSGPGSDDLDDEYRRAARLAGSRPSEAVRRAILEHAAQRAAERAAAYRTQPAANDPLPLRRQSARMRSRWPLAVFGTLAAAGIAGLLVAPQLPWHRVVPAASVAPSVARSVPPRPEAFPAAPPKYSVVDPTAQAPAAAARPTQERLADAQRIAPSPRVNSSRAAESQPALAASRQEELPREAAARLQSDSVSPYAAAPAAADRAAGATLNAAATAPPAANSVLGQASASGDVARLEVLLREGTDINAVDALGRTALMIATENAQAAAVDALLAHGADPNIADARGRTPLAIARASSETGIAAALQRAGAR